MAKRNKVVEALTEKKPSELADSKGGIDTSSTIHDTTKTLINQEKVVFTDDEKGRHFWFVVYPSEAYVKQYYPDCEYDGADGWGEAPNDWIEQLQDTGLAFCVSTLHWKDVNADGHVKKPHWHVIVSWGNTTTYRTARALCDLLKSPRPKLLRNATGAYRYHRHLDNPEKYQYSEPSVSYNGWVPPLDSSEVTRIKSELLELVIREDIQEYTELLIVTQMLGPEYHEVAQNNTFYCERLCSSYRHSPKRVLMRYYNTLPEGELKEEIGKRIHVD